MVIRMVRHTLRIAPREVIRRVRRTLRIACSWLFAWLFARCVAASESPPLRANNPANSHAKRINMRAAMRSTLQIRLRMAWKNMHYTCIYIHG